MNRFDIVGLTLAEISLALLFSFIAIFAPAYDHAQRQLDAVKTVGARAGDLQKQLTAANAETSRLQQELENYRRNLRSAAIPSCFEVGKSTGWLFATIIRGADNYEVLGQQSSLDDLLTKYAPALTQAKQDGCRQRIRIYFGQGVSVADYDYALRRLEEYFYTQKLGAEQGVAAN